MSAERYLFGQPAAHGLSGSRVFGRSVALLRSSRPLYYVVIYPSGRDVPDLACHFHSGRGDTLRPGLHSLRSVASKVHEHNSR